MYIKLIFTWLKDELFYYTFQYSFTYVSEPTNRLLFISFTNMMSDTGAIRERMGDCQ